MNILDLARFCRAKGTPKLKASPPLTLIQYLAWAVHQDYVISLTGPNGIEGIGIAWPVRPDIAQRSQCLLPQDMIKAQDPESGVLYIANWVAPDADGVRAMIEAAADRWPQVKSFLGHRTRADGRDRLVQYPLSTANRLIRLAQ